MPSTRKLIRAAGERIASCGDEGFTLIELMMVVLIIAILLAIAIPTYFTLRQRANDRAVQSNVRSAFAAVRSYYTGDQQYSDVPSVMSNFEPAITWTNAPLDAAASSSTVYIKVYDVPYAAQTVVVAGRTNSGRCFFVKDVMGGAQAGTYYSQDVSQSVTCAPPDPSDPSWGGTWQVS